MIGGSKTSALAVKTNEHNITDALEWIQRQHLHQIQLHAVKQDLGVVQKQNAMSKRGGMLCKGIDKGMILRNQNKKTNTIIKMRHKRDEISRRNLILGRKMHEIFSRKNSNYGELKFVKKRNNSLEDLSEGAFWKGLKINQTSRSNIEIKNNRHLTDQQKQQLMTQISMTTMNEESQDPNCTDRNGKALSKGKGKPPSNLGVVDKVDGPVTYVVPNKDYVQDSGQLKTLSPGPKQNNHYQTAANGFHKPQNESPRQTVMTQMGHQKRQSQLGHHLTNSPLGQFEESHMTLETKDEDNYVDKRPRPEYIKKIAFDRNTKKTNNIMFATQRDVSHFVIRKRSEHIPSLTPVNVIRKAHIQGQIAVQRISKDRLKKNSLGGFHTLERPDNFDFLTTHQPYPSVNSKQNHAAHTSLGYNPAQSNEGSKDHQFMKTQTSFLSQTTSPQLYMEVQRPSILKILNQMNQPAFNKTFTNSNVYTQNTFKKRHRSLNETVRKREASRIRHENHKILLQMNSLRPSPDLQLQKLKKDFKKSESLKKQIVLTKYLQRNEISVKNALKKRQDVYDNLPPVLSPLYELNTHRRSQRKGFETLELYKGSNPQLQSHENSANKIRKNDSNGNMIMQHDQSVQKVERQLMKDNSRFNSRNYSVGNSQYVLDNVHDSNGPQGQALKLYSKKLGRNLKKLYGNQHFTGHKSSLTGLQTDALHQRTVSGAFVQNNHQFNRIYEEQLRQIFSYNQHNHAYKSKNDQLKQQQNPQINHTSNYLRAIETYQNATLDNPTQDMKRRKYYGNLIGFSTTKNNANANGADQGQTGTEPEDQNHQFNATGQPFINYLPLIGGNHQKQEFSHVDNDSTGQIEAHPKSGDIKRQPNTSRPEQNLSLKPQGMEPQGQALSKHSVNSSAHKMQSDDVQDRNEKIQQLLKEQSFRDKSQQDIQKAITQTRLGGIGSAAGQTSPQNLRNAAMNNTITTFSSNIVKGTERSQINTPDLNNAQLAPSGHADTNNLNEQSDQSDDASYSNDYEEDDLKQRKNFQLNEPKVPIKKENRKREDKQDKDPNQAEDETSDNYEENWEDEDQNEVQEQSSKMEDSHAQNSDDYASDNDDFFDKEVKTKTKNAEEYFQELEDKKSKETPEGAQNSNADGGSIFNQTGGNFLNRQPTITSNYKTQQKNQTMMRTTLGGASSGKGATTAAGGTGQFVNNKTDSEKLMKTDASKAREYLNSPVRPGKQRGAGLFPTQHSNKNALVAAHSAVNHRESSSRYELYEETNEMLVESKERVNVNSNTTSPANAELLASSDVQIASTSFGNPKQQSMAFGLKMNKTEMQEQVSGFPPSKKGSKLSDYEDSGTKSGTKAMRTDLQAIEEYKNSPNQQLQPTLTPATGNLEDSQPQPAEKPKTMTLNEESNESSNSDEQYTGSKLNEEEKAASQPKRAEPTPPKVPAVITENDELEEDVAKSAQNKPTSTYSEDSYSDDVEQDQSENCTDADKDSSVVNALNEAKAAGAAKRNEAVVNDKMDESHAPVNVQRTPLDIQERLNRSNDKQPKERTPDEDDEYSEDDEFV